MIQQRVMPSNSSKTRTWLGRIGVAGFLFFLIKGLVWLAVGFGVFKMCL
jgi:hypothetical protein